MMFLHLPTPAEIKHSVVMVILKQKNKCLRDNKHLLLPKKQMNILPPLLQILLISLRLTSIVKC